MRAVSGPTVIEFPLLYEFLLIEGLYFTVSIMFWSFLVSFHV